MHATGAITMGTSILLRPKFEKRKAWSSYFGAEGVKPARRMSQDETHLAFEQKQSIQNGSTKSSKFVQIYWQARQRLDKGFLSILWCGMGIRKWKMPHSERELLRTFIFFKHHFCTETIGISSQAVRICIIFKKSACGLRLGETRGKGQCTVNFQQHNALLNPTGSTCKRQYLINRSCCNDHVHLSNLQQYHGQRTSLSHESNAKRALIHPTFAFRIFSNCANKIDKDLRLTMEIK